MTHGILWQHVTKLYVMMKHNLKCKSKHFCVETQASVYNSEQAEIDLADETSRNRKIHIVHLAPKFCRKASKFGVWNQLPNF